MKKPIAILGLLLMSVGSAAAADIPYAGLQHRQIKALSAQQVDDLRAGRGMGMALAAEINDYPGPRHVLDLSDNLGLTGAQKSRVSSLFDEMAAQAKTVGERIITAEAGLDRLFADKRANDEAIQLFTSDIARLYGELRYVHLRYHLSVRELLSEAQVARYAELRGYGKPVGGHDTGASDHHGHGGHR